MKGYKNNRILTNANVKRMTDAKKDVLRALKREKGCLVCGEKDPVVLDFHHRNQEDKHPDLKKWSLPMLSWDNMLIETGKCEVLCANCHRRKHSV